MAEDTDVVEIMDDKVVDLVEIEDETMDDRIVTDLIEIMNDDPNSDIPSEPDCPKCPKMPPIGRLPKPEPEAMSDCPKSEPPSETEEMFQCPRGTKMPPVGRLSELPLCKRCLTPTDPMVGGCKVSGKPPDVKVICRMCINRENTLRRLCGSWPVQEFSELTEQEQVDFYQQCSTAMADVRKHVSETLVRHRMMRKERKRSGQFLPLSVYEKMGYDTAAIKSKTEPCDIEDHPVLGTTYRVELHGTSRALVEEELRRQIFSKLASKPRRALFGSAQDGAAAASSGNKGPAPADGAQDSETSMSSSDSDDEEKREEKKKEERKKKERAMKRACRHLKGKAPEGEEKLWPGMTSGERRWVQRAQRIADQRAERQAEKERHKQERAAEKEAKKKATMERKAKRKAEKEQDRNNKKTRKQLVAVCTKTIVGARPAIRAAQSLLADPGAQKAPGS